MCLHRAAVFVARLSWIDAAAPPVITQFNQGLRPSEGVALSFFEQAPAGRARASHPAAQPHLKSAALVVFAEHPAAQPHLKSPALGSFAEHAAAQPPQVHRSYRMFAGP